MASIDTGDGGGKKGPGVKKAKKLSTRVDMTPMVDLGFLLITFFIFTTTMAQPTAMNLFMPKDVDKKEDQNKVKESGAFTIMLGKQDVVYYYEGMDPTQLKTATFKTIRDEIIRKKASTKPDDLVMIIKPTPDATYKNTVDILDEMTISEIKRYAMVDISPQEVVWLCAGLLANDFVPDGLERSSFQLRRIHTLIIVDYILFSEHDGESARLFNLVLVFFLIHILRHEQVHCSRLSHGSGENEEGDQQESKIHHRCHVYSRRQFLGFLYAWAFFAAAITSIYTCHNYWFE